MAKTLTTVASNNTFQTWLDRTNEIVGEFANVVTTAGDPATGNAVVNGSFSANNLFVKDKISGGVAGTPGALTFATGSNATFQSNVTANSTATFNGNTTFNANVTLAGTRTTFGAIANLYFTASPTDNKDFLTINATSGALELRNLNELLTLDDIAYVDGANATTNSVLAYDSSTTNTAYKDIAQLIQEGLQYSNTGITLQDASVSTYAPGANGIAVGALANAAANASIAFGVSAIATSNHSIAIGHSSAGVGANSIAIGHSANAYSTAGNSAISIGANTLATNGSIAIGYNANTGGNGVQSIAMGWDASVWGNNSVAIGSFSKIGLPTNLVTQALAVGYGAEANGTVGTAIGNGAKAYNNYAMAIGGYATAAGINSTSIGISSQVQGYGSLAVGSYANVATGANSIAIGHKAVADSVGNTIVIGASANGTAVQSIVIGNHADDGGSGQSVLIGHGSYNQGANNVAIGYNANTGSGNNNVVIGGLSKVSLIGDDSVVIGHNANSIGYAVAIGANSYANIYSIALGREARANGSISMALGSFVRVTGDRSVGIGYNFSLSTANTIALGANNNYFLNFNAIANSNLIPVHNTWNLGSVSNKWANVYSNNIISSNVVADALSGSLTGNVVSSNVQATSLTSSRIVYAGTNGLLQDTANLVFGGTTLDVKHSLRMANSGGAYYLVANGTTSRVGIGSGLFDPDAALEVDGDLLVSGDVTTGYTSDERLKNNVVVIDNPTEKLDQLRGVYFDWNEGIDADFSKYISPKSGHDIGVIAQEVEKVVPEAVRQYPDGWKGVDYIKLVPLLIESVKHLNRRVIQLESQVKANGNES